MQPSLGGLSTDPSLRHSAGRIAWGFRSLFNTPEVIALIRGMNGAELYWRRVVEYCAAGCLQSVWSRPDAVEMVDVPFVDEAAQMSLANVLAVRRPRKPWC
jgi:hypothetical protein